MAINCLAFDLDGTLLNSRKEISCDTIEHINNLNKRIILISSRHYYEMIEYAKQLNLSESDFIVSCDGQYIFDGKGKLIKTMRFLSYKDVKRLSKKTNEFYIYADKHDYYYKKTQNSMILGIKSFIKDIRSRLDFRKKKVRIYSILGLFFIKIEKIVINKDLDFFDDRYNITSYNSCIEITHKCVGKYYALKYLSDIGIIDLDNTMYFGDGINDYQVFLQMSNTVAMGNAINIVKEHSKYITSSCDDDGVYVFLNNYF